MSEATSPADVQATFCATLADQWIARGVAHAVIAPGSRSTPMVVALAERSELAIHVVHDERSAAFVALGLGVSGTAALLVCTSGTAAANFLPAVVEAGLSDIPMIVLTADRPAELRGVGAPQTIDQTHLYGSAVRWFHDPGVPDDAASGSWRALADRAWALAGNGPVHLNLPFREPLLGTVGALAPPGHRDRARATAIRTVAPLTELDDLMGRERGVILAGGRSGVEVGHVAALAGRSGWPVLADPTSGCRGLEGVITAFDVVLRDGVFAREHRPEVVVRVGRPAASKVLATWVASSPAAVIQVGGPGIVDPDHNVAIRLDARAIGGLGVDVPPHLSTTWRNDWSNASDDAEAHIDRVLDARSTLCEPGVARVVARSLPADATLVVASSMPVRDLEWFGGPTAHAHANRGANGIDGTMSTALGMALDRGTVVVLLGDLAFLHDAGALTALRRRDADLRIVVVDNDGGGIFSFLPQASTLGSERFEQLFGTPHGTDLVALARAHGLDADTVTTADALVGRLRAPGPSVTRVASDRADNVAVHRDLAAWR